MIASLRQRTSLRTRLVLTLVLLAMAGLFVSGAVINHQLKNYLVDRVDQQLVDGIGLIGNRLIPRRDSDNDEPAKQGPVPVGSFPVGTYGALYTNSGVRVAEVQLSYDRGRAGFGNDSWAVFARPSISIDEVREAAALGPEFDTVSGGHDVADFRVLYQPLGSQVVVVAMPLDDVAATLTQLLWLEIGVGLVALALLAALAYFIVRAEMRPLERMSATAGQIAAGDLSHRVDEVSGGTEVGRLGAALNVMLSRIEEAFAARQASEARLRKFVADASHELRTPLTSIRGYAEMFHRGASNRPQDLETVMRRIEQESARMSVLVDDMLLLARLDQRRPMDQAPVALAPILTDVGMDMRAAHPNHPVSVRCDSDLWVAGDEASLRQMIVNLSSNACVHTPVGTPVELSLTAEGSGAVVTVADHGSGIPESLAPEVFERFTRADASRGRDAGGSGLGLSIVAAIVEAHGGSVELSTTPGGGATFRVALPTVAPPTKRHTPA